MDRPVMAVLEDAELRARERRLSAASEADGRLAAAAARAAAIEVGVDAAVARSLDEARAASEARLTAALAAIDAEAEMLAAELPAARADAGITAAAERIVAAVLAESPG